MIYLGRTVEDPHNGFIFEYHRIPTKETHGDFDYIIGPFKTRAGAEYMARNGHQNPHCITIEQAERLAQALTTDRKTAREQIDAQLTDQERERLRVLIQANEHGFKGIVIDRKEEKYYSYLERNRLVYFLKYPADWTVRFTDAGRELYLTPERKEDPAA